MSSLLSIISNFTRKHPKAVDFLRQLLPLSLKRKIGSMLLPAKPDGNIKSNDGREFVMIPDRLFLQVVYDGIFEPSLSHFIMSAIKDEDVCVDVGSNFGWFATLMATRCKKVITFEPASRIQKIFQKNVSLNNQDEIVDIRGVAVGSKEGEVEFVIEGDEARESALGYVGSATTDNDNTETVKIVKLENELSEFKNKIALLKMDAEGFEHYAFQGAKKLLNGAHPPVIITEANEGTLTRSGTNRKALCKELTDLGYKLYGMTAEGKLYPDDGKAPALAGVPPKGKFSDRIAV